MNKNTFTIIDQNGVEKTYDVLFTFDNDETKKSYIIYTDNTLDESGNVEVYASTYDPKDEHSKLGEIETEKEWKIIETILTSIEEEVKKAKDNSKDKDTRKETFQVIQEKARVFLLLKKQYIIIRIQVLNSVLMG